jgi:hypothetical protein
MQPASTGIASPSAPRVVESLKASDAFAVAGFGEGYNKGGEK